MKASLFTFLLEIVKKVISLEEESLEHALSDVLKPWCKVLEGLSD